MNDPKLIHTIRELIMDGIGRKHKSRLVGTDHQRNIIVARTVQGFLFGIVFAELVSVGKGGNILEANGNTAALPGSNAQWDCLDFFYSDWILQC